MRRKLRIAFSVVCSALCIACVLTWVRSSIWRDVVAIKYTEFESARGRVTWHCDPAGHYPLFGRASDRIYPHIIYEEVPYREFDFRLWPHGFTMVVPHWSLILVLSLTAATPWLPWRGRFSLRSLFIATTFVAIVLGVVVALLES
jgi:hypothetical protein